MIFDIIFVSKCYNYLGLHFFPFQILASVLLTAHLWQNVKAGIYPVTGQEAGNTYAYFNGPVATPAKPVILNSAGSGGGAGSLGGFGGAVVRGTAGGLGVPGVAGTPGGLSVDFSVSKIILQ
jgi:hypothetical protein